MIRSITLQNFKSFGERQKVPLEPITVLVGPNNSGKSSFMSVGRFIANAVLSGVGEATDQEGGASFAFHRPAWDDGMLELKWESDQGRYQLNLDRDETGPHVAFECLSSNQDASGFERTEAGDLRFSRKGAFAGERDLELTTLGLSEALSRKYFEPIWVPLLRSRMVKLSPQALRTDSEVIPSPRLAQDGAGLASVLGLWRGSQPEKCEELEAFLRRCLPEVRNALVRPAPVPGYQRLWIRQTDGEEFDADHLSDGVLSFIALTMHAIDAGPGQLLFIEEPEHSIHPRRLHELVDLLREIVGAKGCQFVIATHSPVLLNSFRDEPEAILLFRRAETGTKVKRLEDIPELKTALQSSPPGDMLEHGFFNQAF
jgi:predicted ATPase